MGFAIAIDGPAGAGKSTVARKSVYSGICGCITVIFVLRLRVDCRIRGCELYRRHFVCEHFESGFGVLREESVCKIALRKPVCGKYLVESGFKKYAGGALGGVLLYEQVLVFAFEDKGVLLPACNGVSACGDIIGFGGKIQLDLDLLRTRDFVPTAYVERQGTFLKRKIDRTLFCKPDLIIEGS